MWTNFSEAKTQEADRSAQRKQIQIVLWSIWTVFVIGFAIVHWQLDIAAHRPEPIVGLIIHTIIAGLVGLIVMTLIEMRLDPERFLEDRRSSFHDE